MSAVFGSWEDAFMQQFFNTSRGEWGVIGGNSPLDLTSYQLNQIEFNGIEAEQSHEWQPWPEPKFSMLKAYTSDALPA